MVETKPKNTKNGQKQACDHSQNTKPSSISLFTSPPAAAAAFIAASLSFSSFLLGLDFLKLKALS